MAEFGRNYAPNKTTRFSSLELAKVSIEEENLSKLSAFFRFLSGQFHLPPHLRAQKM